MLSSTGLMCGKMAESIKVPLIVIGVALALAIIVSLAWAWASFARKLTRRQRRGSRLLSRRRRGSCR